MKKCLISIFAFMFVIVFSFAHQTFAQETYDFEGTIQVKVGKKKIKEVVGGTVDITMSEEEDEEFAKKGGSKSSHEDAGGSKFESATLNFEFEAEDTDCGDTLDEESIEVDVEPQENSGDNSRNIRIEFDQNYMTDVIGRILEKNGSIVQNALNLDDCFSISGSGEQIIYLWVNNISGTAYIKSAYVRISFSGNSEIQLSDSEHQNQKRYIQRISGKLKIPLEDL